MSKRRRRRSHRRIARFFRGFLYMVVLLAVLAALFWVVSNNRRQKAERAAYKESLTKMEESEDFETTLSTVRTGLDEETLSSTPVPETESEEKSEDGTEENAVETAGQSDSEETASEETADESNEQATEEAESKELTAEASGMKIVVLNGTTISGVAGNWAAKLKESGYQSVTTSNYGGKVEDATVIYGPKELTESLKAVFPNCIFSEEAVPADMQTSSVGQAAFDCYIVIGNQDAK